MWTTADIHGERSSRQQKNSQEIPNFDHDKNR